LAADSGVAPRAAVRAWNAFGIEPLGDRTRAVPVRKFREDAADDCGFHRIDLSFAGRGGDEIIAISLAASSPPRPNTKPLLAKRTLAEIERKLAAIVRAVEDGAYTDTLKARLTKLEQEKAQTEARLCAGKRAPVLRLHTNLPELYRSKIGRLAEALNAPQTVTEAAEIMRGLIDRIVLTPGDGELRAELHGDLAVLARFAQERECRFGGNPPGLSVVAGVGFEPTTFT
jgi:hypothetical protein